ncbi:hypothetical protein A2W57_00115 [Candidatus Giovannonibacteria bacterium RIFCSPHIGHO2_02_43_16]|uniref:Uncharacterized protein n=2 Tax=Candidatus Giovannoniibacteriota TaxID=1752738 RepID=A0A1F5WCT0_9BACT|nr:MAG: hypothetical protein UX06_C0018G0008 [Candidatus Giovannonibacteria bacterium GW2011_GWA2_45_21]OGF73423.1 MAG: hypothetical protein A2W57_00115 [Candidatus Giovannonibacteria bacterium RIFCSPHIGHO2_02_43_16]
MTTLNLRQLFSIFGASIVLVFFAKFFLGGPAFAWVFIFFFSILYLLYSAHVNSVISAASTGTAKAFKALKTFVSVTLVAIILVGFIQSMTGLAIGDTGDQKIATLLYVSLLGLFAMWQAGWTKGDSGKRWVHRFIVLTLIYALLTALFPAVPLVINRFLADGNWIAEAYAKRKLGDELGKVFGETGNVPAPIGSRASGTRFDFPELCPDPNFHRELKQGETVDWNLGNRPGCRVNGYGIVSGEADVLEVFVSGRTRARKVSPRTTDSDAPEYIAAISIKAASGAVFYRAY